MLLKRGKKEERNKQTIETKQDAFTKHSVGHISKCTCLTIMDMCGTGDYVILPLFFVLEYDVGTCFWRSGKVDDLGLFVGKGVLWIIW